MRRGEWWTIVRDDLERDVMMREIAEGEGVEQFGKGRRLHGKKLDVACEHVLSGPEVFVALSCFW